MRGTTHLLLGLIITWLAIDVFDVGQKMLAALLILIASILPDIDERNSKLGRKIPVISWFFKHRTFFHSIIFLVASVIALSFFLETELLLWFAIAFGAHLLLDAMTPMGVQPFWPSKLKIKGFIRVGGLLEKLIFAALLAVFVYLLFR